VQALRKRLCCTVREQRKNARRLRWSTAGPVKETAPCWHSKQAGLPINAGCLEESGREMVAITQKRSERDTVDTPPADNYRDERELDRSEEWELDRSEDDEEEPSQVKTPSR